jgi:hypothetical protein
MKKRVFLLLCMVMVFPVLSAASTINLPRTGQTTSHAVGDDGAVQAGLQIPVPRFTDNSDGTVTDNVSGQIWLKNGDCFGGQVWGASLTSVAALASGSCGLTDGSVAGSWRLPTVNELRSLLEMDEVEPALPGGFPFTDVQADFYWTSTTSAVNTDSAMMVDLYGGAILAAGKTDALRTWPTRGPLTAPAPVPDTGQTVGYEAGDDGSLTPGVSWPIPRFTENGNGTVTDRLTGLVWLRNADCYGMIDHATALTSAGGLADGSCSLTDGSAAGDWRLPNSVELRSLVDYGVNSPAFPVDNPFIDLQPFFYWTSTTYAGYTAYAWYIDFYDGASSTEDKVNYDHVWPVRGGQFGNPASAVAPASKDFGGVVVGNSASQAITVSNTASPGASRLQVNAMTISGTDAGQFSLVAGDGSGGTCGTLMPILDPGASCSVTVVFTPTDPGAKAASLQVSGSDVTAANTDVPLAGTGSTGFTVSASAPGGNGSVAAPNPVVVTGGGAAFTLLPDATYQPDLTVTGTCPAGSWAGATYTTGTVTSDCTAVFSFSKITYPLNLEVTGTGTIHTATSPGTPDMNCSGSCSQSYDVDTVVTLTPTAGSGYSFVSWGGGCTGSGVCQVTMDALRSVTATFADITPPDTSITSAPANPTLSTAFSFSFSSTEAGSTFECSMNGGGWGGCTSPYADSLVYALCTSCRADTALTFAVRSRDGAGNLDPTPASHAWTIEHGVATPVDSVQEGGVVLLRATDYTAAVTVTRPVTFTLRGGYDAGYGSVTGVTTLHGSLTVAAGTVIVDGIAVQ